MGTSLSTAISYVLAAAAMYFFRVTSMLLVIAVLFAWTAIGNILAVLFNNESLFAFDIFLFAFLAYTSFRQYRKVRTDEEQDADVSTGVNEDRQSRLALAKRLFPIGGLVIALLSLGIFVFVWLLTAFIAGMDPTVNTLPIEGIIYGFTLATTVLAFAVSLAAFFSGYPRRRMAVIGMISAVFAYLIQLGFMPAQV
jgi:hypothetical protein